MNEGLYRELLLCFSEPQPRLMRENAHRLIIGHEYGIVTALHIVLTCPYPVNNRAAWAIDNADEKNPGLAQSHLPELVEILESEHYPGVYRSLMRLLERYSIPEEVQGRTVDICFRFLNSGHIPVAVKCHAMQIIFGLLPSYPELAGELKESLLFQMEESSAAFKGRARRILASLTKRSFSR